MTRGYIIEMKALFILGIPIYLVIAIIIMLVRKRKGKKLFFSRELVKFGFVLYILLLTGVSLFPIDRLWIDGKAFHNFSNETVINYIPFKSIAKDVVNLGYGSFSIVFQIKLLLRNAGGNFILLMPLGFFLPFLSRKINTVKKILIIGFSVSLSIEMLQLLENSLNTYARIADIDDLLLNTLGAVVGFLIFNFLNSVIKKLKINTIDR